MNEHLLDYLFDNLPPQQRQRLEAQLLASPEAQSSLERLEQALAPLAEDAEHPTPPPDLVLNTLARIAKQQCALPPAPTHPRCQPGAPSRRWLRPVDWLVAAILLILVGGLGMPLLARLWAHQERLACANNLRNFWGALHVYSDRSEGEFPQVERRGPHSVAGIFVPILTDCGLLRDVSIGCPAQGQRKPLPCTVKELEQLHDTKPSAFQAIVRDLAGDYAYCLGYEEGGSFFGLRDNSGDGLPIMADCARTGGDRSPNHGEQGQNVLFVGGNVRWCAQATVGLEGDHIYLNKQNRVQVGLSRADTVLGASDDRPYPGD